MVIAQTGRICRRLPAALSGLDVTLVDARERCGGPALNEAASPQTFAPAASDPASATYADWACCFDLPPRIEP